jgi:hypothetical protein
MNRTVKGFRAPQWLAGAAVAGVVLMIAGCATSSSRMNRISPGMTRDEVVSALGRPHGVAAQGNVEYLTYNLLNKGVGDMKEYAVKVVDGRVLSFGEKSDFGPNLLVTNEPAMK